jgi:head-tail adaptor
MKAGTLNHRIHFYDMQQVPDGYGGSEPREYEVYATNANVRPLRQDRSVQGNQSVLTGGYEIYFRYRPDITPNKLWSIRYKNELLTISSIQQWEEDRKMWFIIAMAKV